MGPGCLTDLGTGLGSIISAACLLWPSNSGSGTSHLQMPCRAAGIRILLSASSPVSGKGLLVARVLQVTVQEVEEPARASYDSLLPGPSVGFDLSLCSSVVFLVSGSGLL